MDAPSFEALIREMVAGIPADFLEGVTEVTVSPRVVPHPDREGIFTLGECIPLGVEDGADRTQSRIVLYHGSFRALRALDEAFDWEDEAWETLTHELQHHLEWRASRDDLGLVDEAAEANFARLDGEPFDPLFFRGGIEVTPGLFRVEDDWFVEQVVPQVPARVEVAWAGRWYQVEPPPETTLPAYLVLDGLAEPPVGDLVLVLRTRGGWRDLWRGQSTVFEAVVTAGLIRS